MSFYPMDDDEDEAVFSTGAPEKKKNGLAGLRSKSMSYAVEDEDYGGSGDNNKYGFRTKQESKFGKNTFGGDANDEIKRSSLSDRISRYRDNMEDDVPVKKDTKTESKVERWVSYMSYIDGLEQDSSNSSALALELLQSYANPFISTLNMLNCFFIYGT